MDLTVWERGALEAWDSVNTSKHDSYRRHAQALMQHLRVGPGAIDPDLRTGSVGPSEFDILLAAATLHDVAVGGSPSSTHAVPGEVPHDGSPSGKLARQLLLAASPWHLHPDAVEEVGYLVDKLTEKRAIFPTPVLPGLPAELLLPPVTSNHSLTLLREADALVHLAKPSIDWLVELGKNAHLPVAPLGGSAATIPVWGASIVGNLQLLLNCAALSTVSPQGRAELLIEERTVESHIQALCDSVGARYEPPMFGVQSIWESMSQVTRDPLPWTRIRLSSATPWDRLLLEIRGVGLNVAPTIAVWPQASIHSALLNPNRLKPTARYVLKNNVERSASLHLALLSAFALSPFDLAGLVMLEIEGNPISLAPPLVEVLHDDPWHDSLPELGILDGLHRIYAARRLGTEHVRCLIIDGVTIPLPVLPVSWTDVLEYTTTPADHLKRDYRFTTAEEIAGLGLPIPPLPHPSGVSTILYRRLDDFGSAGIRQSGRDES
jgi:hypothetical protein